ncbi:microcystin degradation protein MlrC [Bradyrhizobium sp. JR1.5]|uniref:M81 family metallopeptidase n=1 Tax=unclassified Bradyrhizobium TaxID=2631580 RepID=UPI003392DDE8
MSERNAPRFRVAIAGFQLESVTFVPNLTTLKAFQAVERAGHEVLRQHRGANTPIGGFIKVCEREDIEIVPIVCTGAGAAGPASDEAFQHYLGLILNTLREERVDGVLLDLHGAMTTPTRLDADRDLIEAVRQQVGKQTRIMVAFDYHANLDADTIRDADAVFGYHLSPHTDQGETGERAADCMARTLRGEINPVWALCKPDLMVPSIFSATGMEPLAKLVRDSIELSKRSKRYLDVTVFAGFSYADVPNCGFSVVAVADADRGLARRAVTELCATIRERREAFSHRQLIFGIEDGIEEARHIRSISHGPVVLLEHADRFVDSTHVLRTVIARRLTRTAVPYLWDPDCVAAGMVAGVGAQVELLVGGRSSEKAGGSVIVDGKIVFAGPKTYRATGAYGTGSWIDLGNVVVIDSGYMVISITSRPSVAVSEDCFLQFGMRVADFDYILLRSKTHFRAAYEPICAGIVIIDTPDWGPADLTMLDYVHVPKDRTYPFSGD